MSPAEEKARLGMVQLALERLIDGGPKTRVELFGETNSQPLRGFQRNILKTLELIGVVYKADTGNPPTLRVYLKNRAKALHLVKNPVDLSQVVWGPTRKSDPDPSAPELPVEVGAADPQRSLLKGQPVVLFRIKEEAPQEQDTFVTIRKTPVEDSPQGPPPPAQAPAPIFPPPDQTTQQLMERLLLIMDAVCQRIIYTSEKVDAMETKLNQLWEAFK